MNKSDSSTNLVNKNTAEKNCAIGIHNFIRMQASAVEYINSAINIDQSFVLPKLVKAWMLHGGRDANASNAISELLIDVEAHPLTPQSRESTLLSALTLTRAGDGKGCATLLEEYLLRHPTDLFIHQLIHEEIFWLGESKWMRNITEKAAPAWNENTEGYGSFLAIRAFANEESGHLNDAERFGRMAVEIDSADIWGTHAVAHALLMKGEIQSGIQWLETLSSNWENVNQMRHHLWWHLCLFLFETGQHDRIIELLDTEVRNPASTLVQASPAAPIDIQNYSSLLLRLELYGIDVGNHWQTLSSICADRTDNLGNAFGNIHDMMVLAATGQMAKANELLGNMRERYAGQLHSVAVSYNKVGISICEAILAYQQKNHGQVLALLGDVRHRFSLIGASHAQRDMFYHLLVHAAEQEGRKDLHGTFLREIERIGFFDVPKRAAYKTTLH